MSQTQLWFAIGALVISAGVGVFLVPAVFWLATSGRSKQKQSPESTPLRGGLTIGLLERVFVTGLILVGYPEGIIAVVAVKGLGRFHELKGPPGSQASEKFVIGTLTSYLWAGLVGVCARYFLG